jgi:hypothetical protein
MLATLWAENKRLRAENEAFRQEKEALAARLVLEVAKRYGPTSERRPRAKAEEETSGSQATPSTEKSNPPPKPVEAEKTEKRGRGGQFGHRGAGYQLQSR